MPQGSVLRPLLFLLYINNPPHDIQSQSGYLLMIWLSTWQLIHPMLWILFKQTWTHYKNGNEPGTWSLTQASARYSRSQGLFYNNFGARFWEICSFFCRKSHRKWTNGRKNLPKIWKKRIYFKTKYILMDREILSFILAWDFSLTRFSSQTNPDTKRSKKPLLSQYTLHGQVLETVDNAKYLGVTISKDLNWNNHINDITAKANRTLGFVKRNVKTWNESIKELAYTTLVHPQVEYASLVWSPHTKQNINKTEMIQRRAARWVKNNYSPYESVSSMLDDLGWRCWQTDRLMHILSCFTELYMAM